MTDETCPLCDEPIEEIERDGEITYTLRPCGHQVDDRTYEELSVENGEDLE